MRGNRTLYLIDAFLPKQAEIKTLNDRDELGFFKKL